MYDQSDDYTKHINTVYRVSRVAYDLEGKELYYLTRSELEDPSSRIAIVYGSIGYTGLIMEVDEVIKHIDHICYVGDNMWIALIN